MLETLVGNLVLIVAALMVVFGVVGLAPAAIGLFRGRRSAVHPSAPPGDAGFLLPELEAGRGAGPADAGLGGPTVQRSHAGSPVSADTPAPSLTPGEAALRPSADNDEPEAFADGAEPDPSDEDEEAAAEDETDDLMALFKNTKVASAIPEALNEAYEDVGIHDLLGEARSLRDLLVSGRHS